MGRPLNKKYFGNRNIGTGGYQTTQHGIANTTLAGEVYDGDDHIGGEGASGVNFAGGNIGAYLARIPSVTFPTPTIANGVIATGTVSHVQAVSAELWDEGQGYQVGDIFTTAGTGTTATWRVTSLRVHSFTVANPTGAGNTNYDLGNVVALDSSTAAIGGNSPNWASPFVIKPITVGTGGNSAKLSGGTIAYSGLWTGTGIPPASFTLTAENTRGTTGPGAGFGLPNYGGTGDCNAAGAVLNIVWGIGEFELVTAGDYTAVPAVHTPTVRVSGATPTVAAQVDVYYGVKTIAITEKGSGYSGAESATFSTATGDEVRAGGKVALTQDTGNVGSATNQENAIIAYAWVDGLEEVDIIKQVSTDRYRINSNDTGNSDTGYVIGKLKVTGVASTTFPGNEGTQMNIWAFDADGGSYLVKKLTAHKAVVYPFACARLSKTAGALFAAGRAVPWKFFEGQANASAGYVKIENA